MFAIPRHGLGNGLSPRKTHHSVIRSPPIFEVRRVPILRDKEGCEKTGLVASTRILKTRNVVSVLPGDFVQIMLQSMPFFSQLKKKSEYYYPLNIV